MSAHGVPVVDIGRAVDGSAPGAVATELGKACREVGFVQVVGHGVEPARFHAVYEAAEALWALGDQDLDTWRSPTGHPFRGVCYGTDDHGERVWQRLQNCRIDTPEEARSLGYDERWLDFFGGNVHPDLPGLGDAVARCAAEGTRVGRTLMGLFGIELGLGIDGFEPLFERHVSYFAVQDYPARSHASPQPLRLAEHSDSGALTMLHQRGAYEGLTLRDAAGEVITVPIDDDVIVINTGDLMARWTNDAWPATPHAVLDGPVGLGRSSIAMHHLPDADTTIAPLDGVAVGDGPRYEPVTMYDWDRRYFEKRSLVLSLADGS